MQAKISRNPAIFLALAALALGLSALTLPVFADSDGDVEKDIRVKVIKCEDGDCSEMTDEMTEDVEVIVGDDNAKKIVIRKVRCDGEDCEETSDTHNMVFVGEGGDVKVMAGGSGHAWVSHHGDWAAGGGYLGVGLTELTPELRAHFGVPSGAGVMVSKVMDDSPAARAGLKAGDIIASVDGESVANGMALGKTIRAREDGEAVVLDVWRDGISNSITAAIEEREALGQHRMHLGEGPKMMRKIVVECDSDDGDCESNELAGLDDFDCGGAGECEVEVECKDGGCTCMVNGAAADCADIPGVPGR